MRKDKIKSEKTTAEMLRTVLTFVKEAFCVSGEVKLVEKEMTFTHVLKCTDDKRGVFYIGIVNENSTESGDPKK